MKQETTLHIILYLALIGLLVSIYLTAVHFQHTSAVCDISDTLSCSKVSSSKYSEIFNIPVSIFGGLGYTLLAGISFILLRWKFNIEKERDSYFWGRDKNNQLIFYDDYNLIDGPGYHHQEWYVPARYKEPGEVYWSKRRPPLLMTENLLGFQRLMSNLKG